MMTFAHQLGAITLLLSSITTVAIPEAKAEPTAKNQSRELMVYAGGGKQWHSSRQHNTAYGIDLNFYQYVFSENQSLFIGAGMTELTSNTDTNNKLVALSIYPQLNLALPTVGTTKPFFYVRTLGPTYISKSQLGERQQANHFVFQSQIGLGAYFGKQHQWQLNLSYRHYSNAGLGEPNDGIDATTLLTLGRKL